MGTLSATPPLAAIPELLSKLQVLQVGTVSPPHYEVGSDEEIVHEVLWLQVKCGDVQSDAVRIGQALQLLDHLARTNVSLWAQVLMELWPTTKLRLWMLRCEQLYHGSTSDRLCGRVGLFIKCFDPRRLVTLNAAELAVGEHGSTIPICVSVIPDLASYLAEAIQDMAMASKSGTRTWYRLGHVAVFYSGDEVKTLKAMAEVARHGVGLMNFPWLTGYVTNLYPVNVVTSLLTLMPPYCCNDTVPATIGRVHLYFLLLSTPSMVCLMSAVGASRSVRQLDLQRIDEADGHAARWLAFSLFSSCARHNLHKLSIEGTTSAWFARSFRRVVLARDPVAELFCNDRISIEAHESIRISASRFYLRCPRREGSHQGVVECGQMNALRVITRKGEWWGVLLPAWGHAWVHDDDATVTTHHSVEMGCQQVRALPELALNGDLMRMLPWLSTIGHSVDRLTFGGLSPDPDSERVELPALRNAFPNLRTLRLQPVRLDSFFALYARRETDHWKDLEALSLSRVSTQNGDYLEELVMLLRVLSDNDHPFAKSLQSLELIMTTLRGDYARLLDEVLAMLKANKRLRWFSLKFPANSVYSADVRKAIRNERGTTLPGRMAPLGMREKCALLSAVDAQFDGHILSTIFQFAAVCCRRHVEFDEK